MTPALAFSLLLLGARVARACLRRLGRLRRLGTLPVPLPLLQDLPGSQVVLHIPALGPPLLFPEAVSQFLYLLFRRHSYPLHEELMSDEELLSSFCPGSEGDFFRWHGSPSLMLPETYSGGQRAKLRRGWATSLMRE